MDTHPPWLCLGPVEFKAALKPLRGAVRWAWVGPYGLETREALESPWQLAAMDAFAAGEKGKAVGRRPDRLQL